VLVDYVSAPYRDMKAGDFIYKKHLQLFKDMEVQRIVCITKHPLHQKYLNKMGFKQMNYDDPNCEYIKHLS
ncbi:MAG: hypothetical protein VB066_01400, partial [Paludibacter sp.]|nr:hypothetical protein [Paludibacter sp.]